MENAESTLDGVIMANTIATKMQEVVTQKILEQKLDIYAKDLILVFQGKPRYAKIIDALKDEKLSEAVNLLAMLKGMVNEGIDRKFAKTPMKEFFEEEKKSNIITL